MLTDTVGFFDYCVPLTNERLPPAADSNAKFYDFSIYNYITPPPPARQINQTTSLFEPHSLAPIHTGPLEINRQSQDWITIVFIACLFILAWIRTSYSKRLSQIFKAVAQPHLMNQLERDGNLFKERITIGLGFIYYSISSIFVLLLVREFGALPEGIKNLTFTLAVFAGIFCYQGLKLLLVYSIGIIFETRESARQYQLNLLIFNYLAGVILFPVAVIAFYWDNTFLLYFGIVFISLLIVYRFFRGILTGLTNTGYNLFYLFLYLCTLEILPLLVLYKLIDVISG